MSRETIKLYSEPAFDALYQAILDCADDDMEVNGKLDKIDSDNYHMYNFLKETPRSSLVCHIVDKLRENGFDIIAIHTKE
ncbi:MAG: hypothetical protein J7L15_01065 [Clostridiales bacterium]|nr:hypothetical protein [Clostridiales bacterium]